MSTPSEGDPAPRSSSSTSTGRPSGWRTRGRKLLVYFYPEADTPGCTRQSCDLRDHRQDLAAIGLDVVGISPDAPPKQLAFDEVRARVPAPGRRGPRGRRRVRRVGAEGVRGSHVLGILRSSFLVDEEGRIEEAWSPVTPEDTVPNALAATSA